MSLFARAILYPYLLLVEFWPRVTNWISVRILFKHRKHSISGPVVSSDLYAIYAIYPGTSPLPSVIRSVDTLLANGYFPILVINRNESSEFWSYELAKRYPCVVSRPNIGGDFGAYQLGISLVNRLIKLSEIKNIVLINDSLYFTPTSLSSLNEIVAPDSPYNCLYYHRQGIEHAGSMLIKIDFQKINVKEFNKFWSRYYPTSVKRNIIKGGEHRLSSSLSLSYFNPLMNLSKVKEVLKKEVSLLPVEWMQLINWASRSSPIAHDYLSECRKNEDSLRAIEFSLFNLQVSNSLGLFLARKLSSPLKMDLVKTGLANPSDIAGVLLGSGCSISEINEVEAILKRKGSYFTASILERIKRA